MSCVLDPLDASVGCFFEGTRVAAQIDKVVSIRFTPAAVTTTMISAICPSGKIPARFAGDYQVVCGY